MKILHKIMTPTAILAVPFMILLALDDILKKMKNLLGLNIQ